MNKLVLHAIVMHKPKFKSKEQAFKKADEMFPNEHLKGFVRDSGPSFRVRAVPKTKFIHTSFTSKKITPDITLVWGYLK